MDKIDRILWVLVAVLAILAAITQYGLRTEYDEKRLKRARAYQVFLDGDKQPGPARLAMMETGR